MRTVIECCRVDLRILVNPTTSGLDVRRSKDDLSLESQSSYSDKATKDICEGFIDGKSRGPIRF